MERYEKALSKHKKLEDEVARRKNKAWQMSAFIDQLEKGEVNRDGSVTFRFRNGKEITFEAQ